MPKFRRIIPILCLSAIVFTQSTPALGWFFFSQEPSTVESFAKQSISNDIITFCADDFQVSGGETLEAVLVTSLPREEVGTLTMGNSPVQVGDVVTISAMEGLTFTPTDCLGDTTFTVTPLFSNGGTGESVDIDLYLLAEENQSPVAQKLSFTTYKNVAITERFSAIDPEGDILTYRIVDKPARGAVTMPEDGSDQFVYTPYDNKTGKDTFTYVAEDGAGNVSDEVTVTIQIEKATTTITYADLEGDPAHKAAIRLAEEEIFIGECMGGEYFFQPDTPITRNEFVAMAMAVAGYDLLENVQTTGFYDDDAIPTWAKTYISTALKAGVVQGSINEEGQVVFSGEDTITGAQASVILDRALEVTDVVAIEEETTPTWAVQAVANLESSGVLYSTEIVDIPLTRGEAAMLLCAAPELQDQREEKSWFFWS